MAQGLIESKRSNNAAASSTSLVSSAQATRCRAESEGGEQAVTVLQRPTCDAAALSEHFNRQKEKHMSASINDAKNNLQKISVAIRQTQQEIDNLDEQKRQIERKIEVLQTMETSLLDSERKAKEELARVKANVAANVTSTRTLLDRPQA